MSRTDQTAVMDPLRVGRSLRALRLRLGRRQVDIGREAGRSRQLVSKVESGDLDGVAIGSLRRIGEALGATIDINVRWRGEGLDRLLDAEHAGLVEEVVRRFHAAGWETAVEVSFNLRGERGSVDVMGLHRATATVAVVEVKTVVPDAGPMLYALDRKARLAPEIARTLGWPVRAVGRVLVIADTSTTRRRIANLGATFATAFPARAISVRRWLADPRVTGGGPGPDGRSGFAGLWFLPFADHGGLGQRTTGRHRVRVGK
jgi:transcriptional regulator with XRE-family HTH domain